MTRDELIAWMHARNGFDYGECDHGTYMGGPLHGQPYAMCERQGTALAARLNLPEHTPETRPWRTLVVFEKVDGNIGHVRLPGWAGDGLVSVDMTPVPFTPTPLPYRCHAKVNIGAEQRVDLRFTDWEPTR